MLADFEQQIGYRLPKRLVALLKEQNGGYIRYKLPETPPMQLWGIGQAYPRLMRLADELDESLSSELNLALD